MTSCSLTQTGNGPYPVCQLPYFARGRKHLLGPITQVWQEHQLCFRLVKTSFPLLLEAHLHLQWIRSHQNFLFCIFPALFSSPHSSAFNRLHKKTSLRGGRISPPLVDNKTSAFPLTRWKTSNGHCCLDEPKVTATECAEVFFFFSLFLAIAITILYIQHQSTDPVKFPPKKSLGAWFWVWKHDMHNKASKISKCWRM